VEHGIARNLVGSGGTLGSQDDDHIGREHLGVVGLAGQEHLAVIRVEGDVLEEPERSPGGSLQLHVDASRADEIEAGEPVDQEAAGRGVGHFSLLTGQHRIESERVGPTLQGLEHRAAEDRRSGRPDRSNRPRQAIGLGRATRAAEEMLLEGFLFGDEQFTAGGFTFNQFLVLDDEPLLFHTGPRRMFPLVREAVAHVVPLERLRFIAFSHVEADECGSLNEWLAAAPRSQPLCGDLAAMVSIADLADRPPRALADGEGICLGQRTLTWLHTPHLPHAMECGYLYDDRAKALLCGDLFSQPGRATTAVTESAAAVWEPSEAMRAGFPYASLRDPRPGIEKLAATKPDLLACMHGASFRGDGSSLLRQLREALAR
jgi:glyoxylase-like metal-dependent hydrolase (beta-lactamase superfamily II)